MSDTGNIPQAMIDAAAKALADQTGRLFDLTDRYARVVLEAVEARLALARAATPGPWTWEEADRFDEHMVEALVAGPPPLTPSVLDGMGSVANFAHIAANDPSTVERHCLADLRRLERHQQATLGGAPLRSADECRCVDEWPCPEIRDLAEAYGVDLVGRSEEQTP